MRDFHLPGRSAVHACHGMVATSHPVAAQASLEVLKSGGNAVDAAITGAVLLGLCEPQMTGIGGDMFALVQPSPDQLPVALNGSGRAIAAADPDRLRKQGHTKIDLQSPDAVTIPGAIDGFCTLSESYGTWGMDRCLAPSINYARTGIPVAPRVAFDWKTDANVLGSVAQNFYLSNGKAPIMGDIFRAPKQADVLEMIAKNGRSGFYEGDVARDMVESLQSQGGRHTLDDFAQNKPTFSAPISADYGGVTLLEHPPNGQGATALLMLNMLKEFDIKSMDPWGPDRIHLEAEIAKLAYDARDRFISDPDVLNATEYLLDPKLAKNLSALIDPKAAIKTAMKRSEAVHKDTVYITVIDENRMSVSLIYSIFHGFGSGIASQKYGILFQNRGAGFNLTPGHPNELGPNKRPMHTIIPGMLMKDQNLIASFGVMGGAYQPNGHVRYLSNLVDFGCDPQSAIDAPRSFAEGEILKLERGYPESVHQDLIKKGHKILVPEGPIGGAQSITIAENGTLIGASDPRKDGCAIGY